MESDSQNRARENEEYWRETLTKGHSSTVLGRRFLRLFPGPPRCKVCYNPFGGIGGRVFGAIGMKPSRKNPNICALCCERMPAGGAEVETAVLFADIRGSTALAETLGPERYAAALNDFYRSVTEELFRHKATVDKLIGDEVMAFFVPGFTGSAFKRHAVEAGRALLAALGHGNDSEAALPVGVGVDAGTAFVGNVGGDNYMDFTVLGDPVNTAARIQAAAEPGELLVGEAVYEAVAYRYPDCESRSLNVKGKQDAIRVRAIPLNGDRRFDGDEKLDS